MRPAPGKQLGVRSTAIYDVIIETLAFWGGGLCATQLAEVAGVSRLSAQHAISAYRRSWPTRLRYDARRRRWMGQGAVPPKGGMVAHEPIRFLEFVRGQAAVGRWHDLATAWLDIPFHETGGAPIRMDSSIQGVLSAMAQKVPVLMTYVSKRRIRKVIFSPHRLVKTAVRYHVRGFLHDDAACRDLVIGRMRDIQLASDVDFMDDTHDGEWRVIVEFVLILNPALPEAVRAAMTAEFNLHQGSWRCRGPGPLVRYQVRDALTHVDRETGLPLWCAQGPMG